MEALAETLVGTLERWKVEGPPAYPTTFQYLMESITPAPDETLLGKALKHKTFKSRVMFANPKNHAAPIALTDDRAALATSRVLLDFMLGAARTAATQAFPAKALVKLIAKPLQTEIVSALNAAGPDAVPPGIGFVVINGTRHFFALSDMNAGTAASPPPEVPAITAPVDAPPESFATAFDHAFAHLDRHTGGINFVNLRDLRQNLPQFDRPEFDARLLELRRERRYTLKAAEGLDGLAHEERAAGIQEDGDLLLNVSRLQP